MNKKKNWKQILIYAFYAAVVIFIVKYISKLDFGALKSVEANGWLLLLSTCIRTCSLLLLPLSWKALLDNFTGKKLEADKLYKIYAKSWLGRYIPGKVAWVGGKIYLAAQEGIDTSVAVITSFLDSVLQIFSCMLVGTVFFLFTDTAKVSDRTVYALYGLTAVMIFCLIPPVFNRLVGLAYRILKRKKMESEYFMSGKPLACSIGIVTVSKLISGIGTSCIVYALFPELTFGGFVFSIGVFSVSTAIGMAALFAPAGIGVKESIQLLLLGLVAPKEICVLTVAIISIQSVVIDLAFYFLSKLIFRFELSGETTSDSLVMIGPVYPYKGGIAHYTGLLCRELRKQYHVRMISYKFQYPKLLYRKEQKDFSSDNFRVADTEYGIHTVNPLNWIRWGRKIVKEKPKAVIIQWWHPYFAPCYIVISHILRKKGIKVIYICHNVFPHERFFMDRTLTGWTLKRGSGFVVQSVQDRDDLLGLIPDAPYVLTPHPTYNAFCIRNMSREQAREQLELLEDTPVLLFFGFVREYKGLKYLLEALPIIREELPDIRLYIVGDFGSDKEDYVQIIQEKHLEDLICIRDGYVPDREVEPYFASCDLVVLPYVSATQSGIVQIAYGFDKPVIVTRVGGLPEVVTDHKTGYVVESQSPGQLAEAVLDFFREGKEEAFRENIQAEKQRYSWDILVQRIEELLEKE